MSTSPPALGFELWAETHPVSAFDCGDAKLNDYLRKHVARETAQRVSRCTLAIDAASDVVVGFYCLSYNRILREDFSKSQQRRLPGYTEYGAVLLGRLAVDLKFQRMGIGQVLVVAAAKAVHDSGEPVVAMLADPYESAEGFYRKLGFSPLESKPSRWFISMRTLREVF